MRAFRSPHLPAAAVGLSLVAALTAACGSGTDAAAGPVTVVASTDVWGSVAQAVAGEEIEVTSIITEPSADPHSFETSPSDAAAISDASLVVYNGGGYDSFIDDVLGSQAGEGERRTVNAVELLETEAHPDEAANADRPAPTDGEADEHGHGETNEHVWYDMHTVDAVAHAIAGQLGQLDPDNATTYQANADVFSGQLGQVTTITDTIAATHRDAPVAQTEPIAHYLLAESGLADTTPAGFLSAVENGNDPAAADIAALRELLADKRVEALMFNVQTQDEVTQDARATAEANGIPVVEVTETLPEGLDFIGWQTRTAEALAAALR
ncbi:metal ABC transporter solute-binding protein, Zn/Mn family [Rhodococcus jostii]|uniref:Zinc/manganese transport system substrate-binding protein n=1 Tax=Rhodococcus jostii TaxID=132919 RepID=A0A1H4IPQ2_RHOJO|nr:zinc ABC transporter substrate-binding protein [Rhodococcus jostii]SEB36081.1 zinc/manganese transport system substrate-binding protein [Rhodococcus jostii]